MRYYRVRLELDNERRYKFKKGGGLIFDGVYIGGELFTEAEIRKEYKTHLMKNRRDELFDEIDVPKSSVYWVFGARFSSVFD